MKKYTSAALLALRLTCTSALAVFTVSGILQLFDGYRELMPGGLPLQTTFGFEELLRAAAQPSGKHCALLLLGFLMGTAGNSRGCKSVYTMNRLGLREHHMALVFGLVFTGWFVLYWAFLLALCYGLFVWYSRFTLVGSNAFMLAAWRSEWLHILLPMGEWWGWLRNFALCMSFGFCAAIGSQLMRRGKFPVGILVPPVLCMILLDGRIAALGPALSLTALLTAFTAAYYFSMKGGCEDEDL